MKSGSFLVFLRQGGPADESEKEGDAKEAEKGREDGRDENAARAGKDLPESSTFASVTWFDELVKERLGWGRRGPSQGGILDLRV
jgi:hypothetical protein